uniref:Pyruvate dehydrogenase E1 component subunit beta-3, chloroplastic-like n=1 Tax=Tanacetum cinerariifolium TaxID=118510 RepID=A0A699H8R1_TANCI|nr:pyruvate dehydrogenase E1 component subunit beta-3, chloroplastic-like [Tanacetum cinerariifolium]
MASIFQPIRATTTLTSSTLSSRRFVAEKKVSFVVVRSGVVKDSGLKRICCRGDQFVTNAVAAKADTPAESTASKPGHELLLFEALREGLEEEMERDARIWKLTASEWAKHLSRLDVVSFLYETIELHTASF